MLIAPEKTTKPAAHHQLPQEQDAIMPWVRQL